jgi:hypothetical protein
MSDYDKAKLTFINWRYENPLHLAYMAMVPYLIAQAVIKDHYASTGV